MGAFFTYILTLTACLLSSVAATWKGEGQPLEYFILEELPGGTLIGNVAIDYKLTEKFNASTLQSLSFHIDPLRSTKQHLFAIGNSTGIVGTTAKIDRDSVCPGENVCLAWIHIKVLPEGVTDDIRIMLEIVDVNDHAPVFPNNIFHTKFLESAQVGASVDLPTATDEDSGKNGFQKYELVTQSDLFKLETIQEERPDQDVPLTKLKLKVVGDLKKDGVSNYNLRLVAHDGGNPSKSGAVVVNVTIVDVNDHDPRFDNATYIANVDENSPPGTLVTHVKARDFDLGENAAISYKLNLETDEKYGALFSIDSTTGAITINKPLDFEKSSMYFLIITAMDSGEVAKSSEASVIVRVQDENDNSPLISLKDELTNEGAVRAAENLTVGSYVAQLTVSDLDGGNNGRVECSVSNPTFTIEKVYQAQFKIITKAELDREEISTYTLTVVCHDLGEEPNMVTTNVKISLTDINDNAPVFSKDIYHTHLDRDKALTDALLQVRASDPDEGVNGQVNYKVHPNAADRFAIDQTTGQITMKGPLKLDPASQLQFRVIAYDLGSPSLSSTATVIVNSSPRQAFASPEFSRPNYEFGVFENEEPGTNVGLVSLQPSPPTKVAVNDYEFSFDDRSSDVHSFFSIDTTSGQMKTKTTFDREEQSVYYMAVKAVSRSHPYLSGTVSLTVYIADRNDNAPVVSYPSPTNFTVRLPTNAPLDHPIAQVKALDPDLGGNSKIAFVITAGNPDGIFKISPSTGHISLNTDLSKINIAKFTLQILVSDSGYPRYSTTAVLEVQVVNRSQVLAGLTPGSARSEGLVDSSHATIVVAVTAASLITVFLVLFAVMVFLIWRRMQPTGNKQQGDKYCYSNMEAADSNTTSGAHRQLAGSSRAGYHLEGEAGGGGGGGVGEGGRQGSSGMGMDGCPPIYQQQAGRLGLQKQQPLGARPRSIPNTDSNEYCFNTTDLEKARLPYIEKNILMQANCNRASSPCEEGEARYYNELGKSNTLQATALSEAYDDGEVESDESFVRCGAAT